MTKFPFHDDTPAPGRRSGRVGVWYAETDGLLVLGRVLTYEDVLQFFELLMLK